MGAKSKAVMGAVDALGNKIGALGDYLKEFDPKTYYHYSDNPNIKVFNPNEPLGTKDKEGNPNFRGATYFTSDPKYLDEFIEATTDGVPLENFIKRRKMFNEFIGVNKEIAPTVYPVKIKTDKIFDYTNREQINALNKALAKDPHESSLSDSGKRTNNFWKDSGSWRFYEQEHVRKILKEQGYRGYKPNEPETVALFYPDEGDVRSIFAKFDPSKSKKGEILAAVPAGTLGALGAMDGESSN
tara:strand:+ start:1708 stop:2433 length:726 start_codon:yes stop_codon:yes gene_type:complete